MWIICCGALRSGSTLQYQIVSEIVERKGLGRRIGFIEPTALPPLFEEHSDAKEYLVLKSHYLTPEIRREFERGNARGIYSFRDIRDVVVSMMNKENKRFEAFASRRFIEKQIELFNTWQTIPDLLVSKYESFYNRIFLEVRRIALFLNIELTDNEIEDIAALFSKENNLKRIAEGSDTVVHEGREFSRSQLLHDGHIHSGDTKQWESRLTENEVALVEQRAASWLRACGYRVSSVSTGFVSYSQHGDDYLVWQLLGEINNGLVVEVGAFDGIHLSNSFALAQRGWSALCVEPNPVMFTDLVHNRPDAVCYPYAVVGDETCIEVDFNVEETGVLSGIDYNEADIRDRYSKRELAWQAPQRFKVPARTLNRILSETGVEAGSIGLLSIDVEGFEMEVLNGFDLQRFAPKVVVIEANTPDARQAICAHFKQANYLYIGNNRQNLFFIADSDEIKKRLSRLNFSDYYPAFQTHPRGQRLAIQAKPLRFEFSNEFRNMKSKASLWKRLLKRR